MLSVIQFARCNLFRRFWRLIYYITDLFVCQVLFSTFSNFFRSILASLLRRFSLSSISHSLAFVKYFFQLFSKVFSELLLLPPALSSAMIVYHTSTHFVNTFFSFFQKIFKAAARAAASFPTHRVIFHETKFAASNNFCIYKYSIIC